MPNIGFITLGNLDIYKQSVLLGTVAWGIYEKMDWQIKKIIGDQFITAIDSVGANIAEGYGRFHHRDKIKFYYNSRGSLLESKHWTYLLFKRNLITDEIFNDLMKNLQKEHVMLNHYIRSCSRNIS